MWTHRRRDPIHVESFKMLSFRGWRKLTGPEVCEIKIDRE
jgi:hypothetical protein